MPLEPGAKVGPFEILAPLPSGAPGEAYKASDTARHRVVSLRLLPPDAVGSGLAQRLERESRAVTSLSHPHIAAVYEVGRHDDAAYVVSEFVEGETLAARLGRPLEIQEALRVGIAVADALDKAHRQGLVHRNLSPSSIILTADSVKLTDFGLAAPASAAGAALSPLGAPTGTAPPTMAATPPSAMPYQAPEQLEGREPDARTDLFALGAILYEMAAGRPAFEGRTQALLIAAITSIDPEPLSKVQPMTPPAFDFIVRRCLAKAPQKRVQTAWDVLCQLRWIADGGGQGAEASWAAPRKKRERVFRVALAAAALLALVLAPAAYLHYQSAPAPLEARFIVNDMGFVRTGGGSTVYISPNGRWLISPRGTDDAGVDALELNSVARQSLLNGAAAYLLFWKPDSEQFGFWSEGKLKRASVTGGPATNIIEAAAPFGGGSWSSSGVIVYASAGILYRVLETGGEATPIAKLDATLQETEHVAPYFLPDGRHFLYLASSSQADNSAIYVGSLDSPERTRLFTSDSKAVYADPGYVLFNRGDVVYAQAFDAKKLQLSGEPVRIADGVPLLGIVQATPVSQALRGTGLYAVSQTGVLAYRFGGATNLRGGGAPTGAGNPKSLVWFGGTRGGTTVGPQGSYAGVSLSPDGKRFAVHRHEAEGGDIWIYNPDQGDRMQRWTTNVSQENSMPVWSPDGKRIAFASRRAGKWGIYAKAADNTGAEERIVEAGTPLAPMSWVHDQLVYWVEDPKTRGDIWAVSMTGEHKPAPVLATPADEQFPQLSPDGKWIAYQAPDTMNAPQIWVNSFPKGQGSAWQITNEGGVWPRWRSDGKDMELYFANNGMMAVKLRVVGDAIQAAVPRPLFVFNNANLPNSNHYSAGGSYHRYAVSPDGQSFLMPQPPNAAPAARGGVATRGIIADQFLASIEQGRGGLGGPPNEIAIILNWPRLMNQKPK